MRASEDTGARFLGLDAMPQVRKVLPDLPLELGALGELVFMGRFILAWEGHAVGVRLERAC